MSRGDHICDITLHLSLLVMAFEAEPKDTNELLDSSPTRLYQQSGGAHPFIELLATRIAAILATL